MLSGAWHPSPSQVHLQCAAAGSFLSDMALPFRTGRWNRGGNRTFFSSIVISSQRKHTLLLINRHLLSTCSNSAPTVASRWAFICRCSSPASTQIAPVCTTEGVILEGQKWHTGCSSAQLQSAFQNCGCFDSAIEDANVVRAVCICREIGKLTSALAHMPDLSPGLYLRTWSTACCRPVGQERAREAAATK